MKKAILFFLLLLNVNVVFSKRQRHFYENTTKHEVGLGIGHFTSNDLTDIPSHDLIEENRVIDIDYSYTPAINLHYYYKEHRRIKAGLDVTWQKTKRNTYLKITEVPDYLIQDRDKNKGNPRGESAQKEIDQYKREIEYWKERCRMSECIYLDVIPQIKLTIISRQHFAMYQRYGIGVSFHYRKYAGKITYEKNYMNLCISLLGFEFGGSTLRGYFETLEFSPQGFIHAGIKYDF